MINWKRKAKSIRLFAALAYLLFFVIDSGIAQTGISLNSPQATPSYLLYMDYLESETFLVDNCGEQVHSWPQVGWAQFHPKLLPNGNLMYSQFSSIRELDWDGNLVNEVQVDEPDYTLEYEQIKLENGNYLTIARKHLADADFVAMGYDTTSSSPYLVDIILEVDGTNGDIVWEWNIADHVIQERDANAANFGVVADHPELLDMDAISHIDWNESETFMINGFDYNPGLDQLVLSLRKMSEFIIIDHSTTTEEAAGHSGGNSGKGGDVLYRWGNPKNYGAGTEADRFLYYQHNPNWIKEGIHAGKIVCFNNGLYRPGVTFYDQYSEIPIVSTPVDANGNYTLTPGQAFSPAEPEINYSGANPDVRIFSSLTSGAKVFPNGNVFVIEGGSQRYLELNEQGELIWEYSIPPGQLVYRAEKYELDYPAFEDKDLTPMGPVANTNSTYECELISGVDHINFNSNSFSITYFDDYQIQLTNHTNTDFSYRLFDMNGRSVLSGESKTGRHHIYLSRFPKGIYALTLWDDKNEEYGVYKILVR